MEFFKSLWNNKVLRNGLIILAMAAGVILALVLTY